MPSGRRAHAEQRAVRVNDAVKLLDAGLDVAQAIRNLATRHRLSERQARRYVERARDQGGVEVPQPSVVFTVKLPEGLVHQLRSYARSSGRTLSSTVAEVIEGFLTQVRTGRPRVG